MPDLDPTAPPSEPSAQAEFTVVGGDSPGAFAMRIAGRLNAHSTAAIWEAAVHGVERVSGASAQLDASEIEYCDGAGLALLLELRRVAGRRGAELEIEGLAERFARRLEQFTPEEFEDERGRKPARGSSIEELGRAAVALGRDLREMVTFVGVLLDALWYSLRHPRSVRWPDALLVAETAGVNALPIVLLIGFIIGLIMAFQAAIPMSQFGVEIYVADLVALSMLRELGPLMTAIILAGRSSSAFAAELGSMKINEEIDALTTMGVDPVRFLVVPRVLAATCITPLLAVFANLMGLIGGAVVLLSLGYPVVSYYNQVIKAVGIVDLSGGLLKSVVFGLLVAGVGCMRCLQTRAGASAVGASTTSAVVTCIILVALTDSVFAVVFYYLGI